MARSSLVFRAYACRVGDHSYCTGKICDCFCHELPKWHPWRVQAKRIAERLQRNAGQVKTSTRIQKRSLTPPAPRARVEYHDQPLDEDLVEAIFDPTQPWAQYGVFDSLEELKQHIGNEMPAEARARQEDKQELHLRRLREQSERLKAMGICTYWGCGQRARESQTRCDRHAKAALEKANRRNRARRNREVPPLSV